MTSRDTPTTSGLRAGEAAGDVLRHFQVCPACGQPVDGRDEAAVLHHEVFGHDPLPIEEAERLLSPGERQTLMLLKSTAGEA